MFRFPPQRYGIKGRSNGCSLTSISRPTLAWSSAIKPPRSRRPRRFPN